LEKIHAEQETRREEMIKAIEMKFQVDLEMMFESEENKESIEHAASIETMNKKIHEMKSQMKLMTLKFDSLNTHQNEQYQRIFRDEDKTLDEDIKTLIASPDNADHENIKNRIMEEAMSFDTRKKWSTKNPKSSTKHLNRPRRHSTVKWQTSLITLMFHGIHSRNASNLSRMLETKLQLNFKTSL
jgi:hypothetical protein